MAMATAIGGRSDGVAGGILDRPLTVIAARCHIRRLYTEHQLSPLPATTLNALLVAVPRAWLRSEVPSWPRRHRRLNRRG